MSGIITTQPVKTQYIVVEKISQNNITSTGQAKSTDEGKSTGTIQCTSDGMFIYNGQKVDLGTLVLMLQLDRTKEIDRQIQDQMNEISERNKQLKKMNDLLSEMRSLKSKGSDDNGEVTIDGVKKKLWGDNNSWAKEFGIKWTDVNGSASKKTKDGQWDTNIESLKGIIDGLNSDSQLSMIRLQSLIDKRNDSYELSSNTLAKTSQTTDKIISNR